MPVVTRRLLISLLITITATGLAGCKKSGSGGPTSPSGGSAPAAGTWTGTLTRPNGQASMTVRWQVTVQSSPDDLLMGPLTLTNGANSVTVNARGLLGGNDSQGYSIHLQLTGNAGENAAFPQCSVLGNTSGSGSGDPFPKPYTAITVPTLSVTYTNCVGFVGSGSPNSMNETGRLTLNK